MDITFISRLFKNLFYYFKSWQCTGQDHQIKSIYLHNLYSRRKNSKVWLFRKGLARIRRVFWRISVSSKWCSCCFVARASKPEVKLPAGDFHGGVGRDETRPLVRLSVSSVGWKGSCCAVHDSRMWNWKPRCTPIISPTTLVHPLEYIWPFGVYRGAARHLAACAMIRSIRSLFFPIPLRISSHAFQLH